MQSNDTTGPIPSDMAELKSSFNEWDRIASQLLDLLHASAGCEKSAIWRPHLMQMDKAVRQYRDRCREETERIGHWREDGLECEQLYDLIWDQGDRLVAWLQRIIGM